MIDCISCNSKIKKGYTWENETSYACSEECLLKSGLTQIEINADINAGVVYWKNLDDTKDKE